MGVSQESNTPIKTSRLNAVSVSLCWFVSNHHLSLDYPVHFPPNAAPRTPSSRTTTSNQPGPPTPSISKYRSPLSCTPSALPNPPPPPPFASPKRKAKRSSPSPSSPQHRSSPAPQSVPTNSRIILLTDVPEAEEDPPRPSTMNFPTPPPR